MPTQMGIDDRIGKSPSGVLPGFPRTLFDQVICIFPIAGSEVNAGPLQLCNCSRDRLPCWGSALFLPNSRLARM